MHVRWDKGGEAEFLTLVGEATTLRSTIPSPPGSRIDGTLHVAKGPEGGAVGTEGVRVRVKIHASKRQEDGSFVLSGRPIDLTNETRAKIEALLASRA